MSGNTQQQTCFYHPVLRQCCFSDLLFRYPRHRCCCACHDSGEAHRWCVVDYEGRRRLLDTSNTLFGLMPLSSEPPSEAAPEADGAAALVVWLFQHGTTSLAKAIEGRICLVRRALLPWLVSRFQCVLAVFVSPLWQHFMRGLARLLDSEVAKHCHQVLRAWFTSLSRHHNRLDRPQSANKKASLHQPSSTLANAVDRTLKEQEGHLQNSEQPETLVMSEKEELAQANKGFGDTARCPASLCLSQSDASTAGMNISSSNNDARHQHVEDASSSVMKTSPRREQFTGNWSSVCLYPFTILLNVTKNPKLLLKC